MKKHIIVCVSLLLICVTIGFTINKLIRQTPNYSQRIDSLEYELSSIKNKRDSVRKEIDTTIIKIKENERYYKETVRTITNNNTNEDYIFFINYLKWNRERYDSINYSDSTERN